MLCSLLGSWQLWLALDIKSWHCKDCNVPQRRASASETAEHRLGTAEVAMPQQMTAGLRPVSKGELLFGAFAGIS